jgi:hypothetical protein
MPQLLNSQKSKILDYLKRLAPYSVVERGMKCAEEGHVLESGKSGNKITGQVRDEDESISSVSLDIISRQDIEALCSCCTAEDMQEQWCHHALALLWRACDLGFFDPHSGFVSNESIYRLNTSSSYEIATLIKEVGSNETPGSQATSYFPEVSIVLDLSSDRLGVRVHHDGEEQVPTIFVEFRKLSTRALDNMLLDPRRARSVG